MGGQQKDFISDIVFFQHQDGMRLKVRRHFLQCKGGGGMGSGTQTDKHLTKSPFAGQYFCIDLYESYHSTLWTLVEDDIFEEYILRLRLYYNKK
jgi:hypothetical protein